MRHACGPGANSPRDIRAIADRKSKGRTGPRCASPTSALVQGSGRASLAVGWMRTVADGWARSEGVVLVLAKLTKHWTDPSSWWRRWSNSSGRCSTRAFQKTADAAPCPRSTVARGVTLGPAATDRFVRRRPRNARFGWLPLTTRVIGSVEASAGATSPRSRHRTSRAPRTRCSTGLSDGDGTLRSTATK